LSNFINRAKLIGSSEEAATLLTKAHFIKAKDFISLGPERSMVMSDADRERTAFHEAGHAIVALATPGSFPVQQATIVPHNNALGLVLAQPDEDINHMSKVMRQAQIDMCLGGFLAEEIKYGAECVSFGPASDLKTVNQLAKHMVLAGFGKRTGFFQLSEDHLSSEAAKQNFEDDVKEILADAKSRVYQILKEKGETWNAIAQSLIKHETLSREQLQEIYEMQE
jgi:ATP-dependent Zn protease